MRSIDKGVPYAMAAVVFFAFSEAILHFLTTTLGALPTFLFRIPAMFVITISLILSLGRVLPPANNLLYTKIILSRSVIYGLTAFFLTVSFGFSSNQSYTYLLFFLHPVFTIVFSYISLSKNQHPSVLTWVSIALMISGIAFANFHVESVCTSPLNLQTKRDAFQASWLVTYVCPVLAGLFFAITNLLTKRISERNVKGTDGSQFDSLTLTYYALFIATLGCIFLMILAMSLGINPLGTLIAQDNKLNILMWLGICAVLSEGGGLLSTTSFQKTQNVSLISALDMKIIIISIPLDLWRDTLCQADLVGLRGLGLLFVASGAAILTFVDR